MLRFYVIKKDWKGDDTHANHSSSLRSSNHLIDMDPLSNMNQGISNVALRIE